QNVFVHFQQRQALAALARLLQHQVDVLERLAHAPFGRKLARHHFRAFGPHDLRGGRGALRHLEKGFGVETEPLGKTRPSASASRLSPRIRLTASLARPPSPMWPMWWHLANRASSTGATSSARRGSPPIRATPSPRRTCS